MAKIIKIYYPEVLKHFNSASTAAAQYQQARDTYPEQQQQYTQFHDENVELLYMNASKRTVMVLMAPMHLGAAVFEGMQLTPMLEGIVFGTGMHSTADQFLLSVLTVSTLFGASLLAGYCFYEVNFRSDAVVPGRNKFGLPWLMGGLALSLIYVGSILWLAYETAGVSKEFNKLYFLGAVATIEIALSAAAIVGYTYLFTVIRLRDLNKTAKQTKHQIYEQAEICAREFRFYRLALDLYNQQQNLNLACVDTPAIAEAISFHEGFIKLRLAS